MSKSVAFHALPQVHLPRWVSGTTARRLAYDGVTLALGCTAAVMIALGVYLMAPPETREAIPSTFLGLDAPNVTFHGHPPLAL